MAATRYKIKVNYLYASALRAGDTVKFGGQPYLVTEIKGNDFTVAILCVQAFDHDIKMSIELPHNAILKVFREVVVKS
jgi:hypothetical protein